ncbi:MAG: addiction module protein [Candidatus Sumerlaeota bacterium]|nr:addiction module protein [Candidatus Sumerlaeota bacterium]
MDVTLPLDKMTTSEKLRALEQIWDDLCRGAEEIPSPAWHADVLRAREKRVKKGESRFVDWDDAKRSIRDRVR